jgi:hypothetical protein
MYLFDGDTKRFFGRWDGKLRVVFAEMAAFRARKTGKLGAKECK